MKKARTICLFGTYKHELPSSTLISSGLAEYGSPHRIITVHEPVPVGFIQNAEHLSASNIIKRLINRLKASFKLVLRTHEALHADVFLILTPGQTDVMLALILKVLLRKKIVYIPQISLFDLLRNVLSDKKVTKPIVKLSYAIERVLFMACDLVLFNTEQEVAYHKDILHIPRLASGVIPLGADDTVFYPTKKAKKSSTFEVLYYGEYIPAHGAQTVAIAALLLEPYADIHFTMIGEGKGKPAAIEIIEKAKLKNVTVKGWISPVELAAHIRKADLVMGFLGQAPLVERSIPNKVYQGMASGKCVVTGESKAIRQTLEHKENIYITQTENSKLLSETILLLKKNSILRERIGKNAYNTFSTKFNRQAVAKELIIHIEGLFT